MTVTPHETFSDRIVDQLAKKLSALPPEEMRQQMRECLRLVRETGVDSAARLSDPPEKFAQMLMRDFPWQWGATAEKLRRAAAAESPESLILSLLPSDGHLD